EALARKTVYTLTVTRGDPSAGDSSGGAAQSAPTVAAPIADLTGLEAGATRDVSLSGVFSDADGDSLTVTAASSDEGKATVTVSADGSKLAVAAVAVGAATVTVTARDADGNTVSDAFEVAVVRKYAALISQMYQWRNDPQWVSEKAHTDRWDRALLAFGETVADQTLTPMTAAEAQGFADRGWTRWVEVAKALREIEAG
ncbi:MAG: Ig-like domain-containing protein, partial [Chloroflexi bacterium]|nr:Ig-like domain-containing protein [Chloroflexota bacterium]